MTTKINHRISSKVSAVLAGAILATALVAILPGAAGASGGNVGCAGDWNKDGSVTLFDFGAAREAAVKLFGTPRPDPNDPNARYRLADVIAQAMDNSQLTIDNFGAQC